LSSVLCTGKWLLGSGLGDKDAMDMRGWPQPYLGQSSLRSRRTPALLAQVGS
jgi:hypothetical protein